VICEKERTEKACGSRWYHELQERAICEQERTEKYNVFELELTTQFAASLECAGITVVTYGGPRKNPNSPFPDLSQLPYWSFSISYSGDEPTQFWQMLPPKGSHLPLMQATGTPAQIATQVCTITNGKGGVVREVN
jgi:hypothetical protein